MLWNSNYKYSITKILDNDSYINDKTNEILNKISLINFFKRVCWITKLCRSKSFRNRNNFAGGAETILLDEPTAGMSKSETERATS